MGVKLGRMKGNKQKAEYLKMEGKHGKPGGTEVEKPGSRKAERRHLKSSCEAERGRRGKEEQRLSSQNPKLKRTKEC